GFVYVSGYTSSLNFPVSLNALQSKFTGGYYDAFIAKLDIGKSRFEYATYFGGSGSDVARGIAVDSNGSAYITGSTDSADLPLQNYIQRYSRNGDVFIAELDPAGSTLRFSSYIG